MATFTLVHGGWGGGWQWQWLTPHLVRAGHRVTTLTLTGLGERAHMATHEPVSLQTHIDDLCEHLWFENLDDVYLVGWSYGAVPVEGVADRMPERLTMVITLDGHVPCEGVAVEDGSFSEWPPKFAEPARRTGWMPPPSEQDLADTLTDPELRHFVADRERPQPTGTWTTPFPDTGGRRWQVPHVYIACTEAPIGEEIDEEQLAEWANLREDPRWQYQEVALNHLALIYAPEVIAEILLSLPPASR
jgi:pimeloyl-ACP methyl ester carboxylesterase